MADLETYWRPGGWTVPIGKQGKGLAHLELLKVRPERRLAYARKRALWPGGETPSSRAVTASD